MQKVILASTSPYRKLLLERISLDVKCVAPLCDENVYKNKNIAPAELATKLSELKLDSIRDLYPNDIIIAGDQVAALGEEVLSKPGDVENAVLQLNKLSGNTHKLFTAITVAYKDRSETIVNETTLQMKELSEHQIRNYVNHDKPFDCAGSYKIESKGIALFNKIDSTDHTAIIGIPLMELSILLEQFNVDLFLK